MGDLGLIPRLGRFPGEGKGYPLQYSGLENSMDYSPWDHKESDMTEQLSTACDSKARAAFFRREPSSMRASQESNVG